MKAFLAIAALLCFSVDSRRFSNSKFLQSEISPAEKEFIDFILTYRRSYGTQEEYEFRLAVFTEKFEEIQAHNQKQDRSYQLAINQFSDLTDYEFSKRLGYNPVPRAAALNSEIEIQTPNGSSIDWVTEGAVTQVKDQGSCGSCWAFSTTGSLEGQYFIKNGVLLSFSEQQLVDCDSSILTNHGCSSGHYKYGFDYAIENGMATEEDYRYIGQDGQPCSLDGIPTYQTITSYEQVAPQKEGALLAAIEQGPVSVAVQANQMHFQAYGGGILDSNCGTNLDHAVLAVGYGTEQGQDFYKVKNSWGPMWGEMGYIRIARNGDGAGLCGIQMDPYLAHA